jgi:hypothetical protein
MITFGLAIMVALVVLWQAAAGLPELITNLRTR